MRLAGRLQMDGASSFPSFLGVLLRLRILGAAGITGIALLGLAVAAGADPMLPGITGSQFHVSLSSFHAECRRSEHTSLPGGYE